MSIGLEAVQVIHEAIAEAVDAERLNDHATAGERWREAADLALKADGMGETVADRQEAIQVLQTLERNLAEEGRFVEVAVLLWGNGMFDSRPSVVQKVFKAVHDNSKLIILGGSSLSKTFSCGVYFYLEWRRDPYWTAVKLAAPSEDHLYTNLFSHLVALHKGAVIPMTEDDASKVKVNETDLFISMADALPEMRIQGVLCKQSQISAGALRGHKPKPYRKPIHPKYGNSTRLFILIDEGTQVSPGAFEDIKTTEASIDPLLDTVKIVMPCNPEGITYKIVQMAEPEEGWDPEQVDTLYSWTSKQGYPVLRLDGKRFENVVERRTIYPRMLTYEAFLGFLKAGEHSATYWAKGRGFPPLKDNAYTIIPPSWVQSQRGDPIYVGKVDNIAALDTALGGGDKAIFGVGRWGEAAGWTKMDGTVEWFVNRADPTQKINKHVCVLDQLFQLQKTQSTVEIMQEVMGRCKSMGIPPENLVMDSGGNAAGVWSHAKTFWGDVLGVSSGTAASDERVLSDDQMGAYDQFQLKATELWFAFKKWLDPVVCAMLIQPTVPTSPLFTELTTRRYYNVKGGKVQVEAKDIYRARNHGASPDCFIAGTMVTVPGGEMAIENVRPGDVVMTPHGPVTVIVVHRNYTKKLATLTWGRRVLTGKPAHKIFTWNRGWVRMDSVLLIDELEDQSSLDKWKFLAQLTTTETVIGFKTLAATIRTGIRMRRSDFFIGLSGLRTLGVFLKGFMFIIKMATGRIIDPKTWNCSRPNNMPQSITLRTGAGRNTARPFLMDKRKPSSWRGGGIQAKKGLLGIQKTGKGSCKKENRRLLKENTPARNAGKSLLQHPSWGSRIALYIALEKRRLTVALGRTRSALSAIATFFAILTERRKPALSSVAVNSTEFDAPVYNLTLEKHNVYYANGILVQNCADTALLLVEWCRQRGKVLPGIMEKKNDDRGGNDRERVSLKNADEPETLGTEAQWEPNRLDAE